MIEPLRCFLQPGQPFGRAVHLAGGRPRLDQIWGEWEEARFAHAGRLQDVRDRVEPAQRPPGIVDGQLGLGQDPPALGHIDGIPHGFGPFSPVGGERPGVADVAVAGLEESDAEGAGSFLAVAVFLVPAGGGFGERGRTVPPPCAPFDLHEVALGGKHALLDATLAGDVDHGVQQVTGRVCLPAPQMPQRQRRLRAYGGKGHVCEPWQPGRRAQLVAGTGVPGYRGAVPLPGQCLPQDNGVARLARLGDGCGKGSAPCVHPPVPQETGEA